MVVSRVVEDHVRSVSDVMGKGMAAYRLSGLAALPPVMEMPLVHARERAEFYRMSASSMWAPQFLEASRVVGEQGRAVSETIAGGMEAYSRRVSPLTPPIVEALATSMIAAPSVQEAVLPFFSAVSRVVGTQYLKPVAGAPLMQEYLAMGAGLRIAFEEEKGLGPEGVEVKEPTAVPPGVVTLPYLAETMKAVSSYGYAGAGVGMKQALTALSTISREAAAPTIEARKVMVAEEVARIEVERALRSVEGGVIEDLVHLPAEGYALERIPVGPISFPTMKLQELAPFIQYIQTQAKTSTAPMQSTFNFNINVESLRDESDLRELEWKITRILKEQARRYGLL
jgi:hypothetical protein